MTYKSGLGFRVATETLLEKKQKNFFGYNLRLMNIGPCFTIIINPGRLSAQRFVGSGIPLHVESEDVHVFFEGLGWLLRSQNVVEPSIFIDAIDGL